MPKRKLRTRSGMSPGKRRSRSDREGFSTGGDPKTRKNQQTSAPSLSNVPSLFDEFQKRDLAKVIDFLTRFWQAQSDTYGKGRVTPPGVDGPVDEVLREPLPDEPQAIEEILEATGRLLEQHSVHTRHPMFLGYVTPPSLDIAALGDALAAILNQNVSFAALSPIGASLETKVISWLGQIVGYTHSSRGGILTSGGSNANLYGLAAARVRLLGANAVRNGNYAKAAKLRIYCSEYTHHSIDKAAMMMGLGTRAVVRVPANEEHQINIRDLAEAIKTDSASKEYCPMAIVGNAGTRLCGAFDDLQALKIIADQYRLWFHVDAAYGGFLRLANKRPPQTEHLPLADSIVLDPHKLLFVPFDCGALLIKNRDHLMQCFGSTGEYLELEHPAGTADFADLGMQLGRSMKALKVWLTLKYIGIQRFAAEYSRLMALAHYLKSRLAADKRFELLGPVPGTAVCFRWCGCAHVSSSRLDAINSEIRRRLLRDGVSFSDEVEIGGRRGLRVCFTNFRTEQHHLDDLLVAIARFGEDPSI